MNTEICAICLNEPIDTFTSQCGHITCKECIGKWANNHNTHYTCVLCRQEQKASIHDVICSDIVINDNNDNNIAIQLFNDDDTSNSDNDDAASLDDNHNAASVDDNHDADSLDDNDDAASLDDNDEDMIIPLNLIDHFNANNYIFMTPTNQNIPILTSPPPVERKGKRRRSI